MNRTLIKDLIENIDKPVLIQGWIQELRNLSKIKFVILRDRSGDMQTLAFKGDTEEESFLAINDLTRESVVEIEGTVKKNKESRWGIEVLIKKIKLISKSEVPLPIDNTEKGLTALDKRLDHRFLDEQGFTNITTSKMTTIGVESGAELFEVDYFGKPVYLAQSPQVYKQMFMAGGFERVYEIGPIFRAEKSHTMRHLTEFTGVDLEFGFIKDYTEIMDFVEKMFADLLVELPKEAGTELKLLGVEHQIPKKIPRISMEEAKVLLAKKGKKYKPNEDLDAEGEKLLGEIVKEKYGSEFVFLTEFPVEVRPFYHMHLSDNPKLTKSFDLIFQGVEICTGAQREHRSEILKKQAKEKGLDLASMKEYAEIFCYGIPAHGGVGFGLDRITQKLLNLDNVREAVLLPRDPERVRP